MNDIKSIEIPAPDFGLNQFVTLYWNDEEIKTRIVARWYDLDHQNWWYKIANSEIFYSADVLEKRQEN